ncbi:MAG TPA: hypothetical protein PKY05_00305 [Fibrobacteria bacterium]|nr:hypothetical protein [Fibrobacteria bacterium]
MSGHLDVLRSLTALLVGGDEPVIQSVEAQFLDEAQAYLDSVEADIFPNANGSLARWESIYGLSGAGSNSDRLAAIVAAIGAAGGISKSFFEGLATSMGFAIQIVRGVYPFRAGVSSAGDPVKEVNSDAIQNPPGWNSALQGPYPADLWIWEVHVNGLGGNQNSDSLKTAFLRLRPAFTSIRWVEAGQTTLLGAS